MGYLNNAISRTDTFRFSRKSNSKSRNSASFHGRFVKDVCSNTFAFRQSVRVRRVLYTPLLQQRAFPCLHAQCALRCVETMEETVAKQDLCTCRGPAQTKCLLSCPHVRGILLKFLAAQFFVGTIVPVMSINLMTERCLITHQGKAQRVLSS